MKKNIYVSPESQVISKVTSCQILAGSYGENMDDHGQHDTEQVGGGTNPDAKRNPLGWQSVGDWDNLNDELR